MFPAFRRVPTASVCARSFALLFAVIAASPVLAQVIPPVPLTTASPTYPLQEEPSGQVVDVTLAVIIESDGHVGRIRVITSGGPAFDAAAIEAMHQWTFQPATRDGVPVAVEVTVPVHFEPRARAATQETEHAAGAPHVPVVPDSSSRPLTPPAPVDAGETRVAGRRGPPPSSMSDLTLELGQLRSVPRTSSAKLLTLAPGVVLQNHGGDGHPDSIFLRGFDAGEGQDIALSIEGVPLNEPSSAHGHGFADTNVIPPELVRAVRVSAGPFDPRQGDFAVAGSADFSLAPLRPGVLLSGTAGSFNTMRLVGSYQPDHGASDTFVGFFLKKSDGFGDDRASSGGGAHGAWEVTLAPGTTLRALAIGYASQFDSAGAVREDDVAAARLPCVGVPDAQFFCAADDNQGGAAQRGLASLALSSEMGPGTLTQQLFGSIKSTRFRENHTGFLDDARGDGLGLSSEGFMVGGRGAYRVHIDALGQRQDLELGVFARHDEGTQRAERLRFVDGAPYATAFHHDIRVTNLAGYATGRFVPVSQLAVQGGVRADAFAFGLVNRHAPTRDAAGDRLAREATDAWATALQPRVSAAVKLIDQLTWQTSLGVGTRSADVAGLPGITGTPLSTVRAGETGLGFATAAQDLWGFGTSALDVRGGLFSTDVSRDLVFDEDTGRGEDVGRSWRFGAWAFARGALGDTVSIQLSGATTEAYLVDSDDDVGSVLNNGARLPYLPRLTGRADVAAGRAVALFGETLRADLGVGLMGIGPRPMPFAEASEPVFLVDTNAQLAWRALTLGVAIENLFDARWRSAVFSYPSHFRDPGAVASEAAVAHFSAGAPRTVLFTLTLHLDV